MTHLNIMLRTCSEADVENLTSLGKSTFKDTFADANTPEDMALYLLNTFTEDIITRELHEPGSVFFIAEENGSPAGYAKVRNQKTVEALDHLKALEIERLYAVKDWIGKGIGSKLMQHCLDYAVQQGYDVVWLGVWEHNQRAIQFYKQWGFEKFGEHVFMLGSDAQTDHLMKKNL